MSKYIKLYDAIMAMDEWFSEPITPTKILSDLPTIEVSEDCISKAYLEQEIENQAMTVEKDKEYWRWWNNALDKVVELIEDAPSVVPIRAECEWINDTRYSGWTCTNCNYHDGNAVDNYCPNCGAKMKGADDVLEGDR